MKLCSNLENPLTQAPFNPKPQPYKACPPTNLNHTPLPPLLPRSCRPWNTLVMGQELLLLCGLVSSCVWQTYISIHKGHMYLFTYCQFLIILDKTHTLKSQHDHPKPPKNRNPKSRLTSFMSKSCPTMKIFIVETGLTVVQNKRPNFWNHWWTSEMR